MATVVDAFAGSNESAVAVDMGGMDTLLARFVKLGRLDAVDIDVVVAVILPPRPKPVPVAMVGVPKVKPVSPCNTKSQNMHQKMCLLQLNWLH